MKPTLPTFLPFLLSGLSQTVRGIPTEDQEIWPRDASEVTASPMRLSVRYIPPESGPNQRLQRWANSKQTGNVVAALNGGGWTVPVTIGGQNVTLTLDSFSADLLVSSTLQPSVQQADWTTNQIYDPSKSSTYKNFTGTFSSETTDNFGISGIEAKETVTIGGLTLSNFSIGLISNHNISKSSKTTHFLSSGTLGLGAIGSSLYHPQQPSFPQTLAANTQFPLFTTNFKPDNAGTIEFGAVDKSAYTGPMTQLRILNLITGYQETVQPLTAGKWLYGAATVGSGTAESNTGPIDCTFDLLSPRLALPERAVSSYYKLIPGSSSGSSSESPDDLDYSYPCSATLPDLVIAFNQSDVLSGPTHISIPGKFLEDDAKGNSTKCKVKMDVSFDNGINVGNPFLMSQYLVWNFSSPFPTLGIARQA